VSRILTLQRQARELGRLRNGYTEGKRPVKSETWVVTSHAEHYVEAAAAEWGGTVEPWQPQGGGAPQFRVITETSSLDAILPPGDPLSQTFELWSGGGCQRRCDGVTEFLSDSPCMCEGLADRRAEASAGKACKETTRLNVILPSMPDLGVWRMETHSFWAANEVAAAVDLIIAATGGRAAVPIRLRLEPRQVKRAGEQLKKFIVPVVEIRGATAGQLLSGSADLTQLASAPALGNGSAPALAAGNGNGRDWLAEAKTAKTVDALRDLYREATQAGAPDEVRAFITERGAEVAAAANASTTHDPDELWALIVAAAPVEWSTQRLEEEFAAATDGTFPGSASAEELQAFLHGLKAGAS